MDSQDLFRSSWPTSIDLHRSHPPRHWGGDWRRSPRCPHRRSRVGGRGRFLSEELGQTSKTASALAFFMFFFSILGRPRQGGPPT